MDNFADRKLCYERIEAFRERPLIVFATSTRSGVPAQMAADVVREFVDQIDAVPASERTVDVLLHSTGGDALAAWKLMSLLRERFDTVDVLVPFMAFSAATLFALGADKIVMHPHASLGPIDPQITIVGAGGATKRFAYEDVGAFLRFLEKDVRITEQVHVSAVVERLFSAVDPLNVGAAARASELSSSVGERLLLTHMKAPDERTQAREIADNLNKSFFAHGDAISRGRAKDLHLKIAESNPELEKLIWKAFEGLEAYMEFRTPFNPLSHFLSDPAGKASLAPPAPVAIPPGAPPTVAQGIWNVIAQNVVQGASRPGAAVKYSVVNAVVESLRVASEFKTEGEISAVRNVAGEIQLSVTNTEQRWRTR